MQLEDLMRQGKLTTDVIVKAGHVFGEAADKQGTLAIALQQSAAQQTRFNNRLKEMSLLILRSGLDEFLANLFKLGSEAIPIVTNAAKWLIKAIKTLWHFVKALGDYIKDHPLFTGVMVAALLPLISTLMIMTRGWVAFGTVLFGISKLLKGILTLLGPLRAGIVVLALLLADFENFFVLGNQDGILGSWKNFLEHWIIMLEYYFARARFAWDTMDFFGEILPKENASDGLVKRLYNFAVPDYLRPEAILERQKNAAGFTWDVMKNIGSGIGGFLESATSGRPTDWMGNSAPASQQVAPPLRLPQGSMNINLNIENMPPNVIEKMNSGDWQGFGRGIGQGIQIGGLGYNIS